MKYGTLFSISMLSALGMQSALASETGGGAEYVIQPGAAHTDINYLSANQNRRLSLQEGLSLDTLLPQFNINENVYLTGLSRLNNDEQHLAFGLNVGNSQLSVMTGQGVGFSRLNNQYTNVDPYYFHGGTSADYSFNNIELAHQFGAKTTLQIGQAQIRAENLEDRYTQYIGAQVGAVNAHYMQVNRENEKAGEALSLGFKSAYGVADWSMLKQEAGGEIQQFSFSFKPGSYNRYRLALSNRQNPLIDDDDGYRLMVGFSRPLGYFRMGAAESAQSDDEVVGNARRNKIVLIGGAAVAAGVVLSSGSDDQDSTPRLGEQHAAAREVLNNINPVSVRINREHGGWIYQTLDGRYTYTRPVQGGVASVQIPQSLIPKGGTPRASYHTHAGPDPRYLNEQFSPADFSSDNASGVDGYLGTPAGNFLYHKSGSNKAVRLGSIAH